MGWAWTVFAFLAVIYLMTKLHSQTQKRRKRLPPAPKMLPIIGNLHLLGKLPHRDLHQLSKLHGPIMYMQLGSVPAIIVSSPQSAELFLKKHHLVFASRPPHQAAIHIAYNQTTMSFSPYGSYWREMRKFITLELLTKHRINSLKSMRKGEIALLMDSIKEAASARVAVDLSARVSSLTTDMSCLMVFGKKYVDEEFDEKGFRAVIHEGLHISAVLNIADFIPLLAAFDLQGLTRRMKAVGKVFDKFFEKIIDEHIDSRKKKGESHSNDFLNIMLGIMESKENEFQINRTHIKATIMDLLVSSMDTSSTTIEWVLSELILHPEVMKKLQKELETKVGLKRMVEESDLERLEYLEMVIKETLRLHPVAPLLLPHMSTEDITIENFHIPKNSRVLVNVWAIGRDPNAWPNEEKFMPERFMGSDIDVKGRHFQLIPFGSGRRGCPGIQLGLTIVRLVLANLVHCFDWELPHGMLVTDLDMTEEFGITIPRAKHLMAVPSYRLLQNISSL